jgi:hypothetical protein
LNSHGRRPLCRWKIGGWENSMSRSTPARSQRRMQRSRRAHPPFLLMPTPLARPTWVLRCCRAGREAALLPLRSKDDAPQSSALHRHENLLKDRIGSIRREKKEEQKSNERYPPQAHLRTHRAASAGCSTCGRWIGALSSHSEPCEPRHRAQSGADSGSNMCRSSGGQCLAGAQSYRAGA